MSSTCSLYCVCTVIDVKTTGGVSEVHKLIEVNSFVAGVVGQFGKYSKLLSHRVEWDAILVSGCQI